MTSNISRKVLILSASLLLAAACGTPSDARPHNDHLKPQIGTIYADPPFAPRQESNPNRDSSCFNVSGLPEMFACSPKS
jgi:hypothetical protein